MNVKDLRTALNFLRKMLMEIKPNTVAKDERVFYKLAGLSLYFFYKTMFSGFTNNLSLFC